MKYLNRMLIWMVLAALALSMLPAVAESSYQAEVTADSAKVYAAKSPYKYLGTLPKGTVVTVKEVNGDAALITAGGKTGIVQLSALTEVKAEAGKAVITLRETKVYKKASKSSKFTTVKAGTAMTRLAVSNGVAKVSYNGKTGYVSASDLGEPGSAIETNKQEAVVTTRATKIYKKASTSSRSAKLAKGAKLTMVGVSGSFAKVSYNGKTGYVKKAHLTADTAAKAEDDIADKAEEQAETVAESAKDLFSSGDNENIVFQFCVKEMGLNRAAACGIVANVRYESDFKPTLPGDGGTSYGICQWHASRKTDLINWCERNGYDYTTLKGQLYYLKYDVKSNYPSVYKYLNEVDDTAEGAYDAGYYFCYNFEAPAARTSQSTARGNYAQKTLYPKYSKK